MRDTKIMQIGKTVKGEPAYIVECGCETFVFTDKEELKVYLDQYIEDPVGYEKRYYERHPIPVGGRDEITAQTTRPQRPDSGLVGGRQDTRARIG